MHDLEKRIVGITFSTFDFFHAGHVKMLEEAKSVCDFLIVGLQFNPNLERKEKNQPSQSIVERYIQLNGCEHIDQIIPYVYEREILEILKKIKIDIRIIGVEYKNRDFSGKDYCINNNIRIHYNSRDHSFSSSAIRSKINSLRN